MIRNLSPGDPIPDRWSCTIDFARDLLAQESDEVKTLVEQYRLAEAADEDDEDVKVKERKR